MATVYIWGAFPHDHASISFRSANSNLYPRETYVSVHPKRKDIVHEVGEFVAARNSTQNADHGDYGDPVATVLLSHLDEDEMEAAYQEMELKYNFFEANCSTVVMALLKAGFGAKSESDDIFRQAWQTVSGMINPNHRHASFLEASNTVLERVLVRSKRSPLGISGLLLLDIAQHQIIARPGDVLALAKYYFAHEKEYLEY